MSDENNKPAFYIFTQNEKGETVRIGAAFAHKKGKGLNIVMDGKRYAAFPPKVNQAAEEGEGA